jgi:hypothetical protein
LEAESTAAKGIEKFVGERIAGADFVGDGDGDQAEFVSRRKQELRSSFRG